MEYLYSGVDTINHWRPPKKSCFSMPGTTNACSSEKKGFHTRAASAIESGHDQSARSFAYIRTTTINGRAYARKAPPTEMES